MNSPALGQAEDGNGDGCIRSSTAPAVEKLPDLAQERMPISRRDFFILGGLDVAAIYGTYELLRPSAVSLFNLAAWSLTRKFEDDAAIAEKDDGKKKESEKAPKADYSLNDTICTFPDGLTFRNLGVAHEASAFLKERDHILEAITQADVVLLEGCPGQEYFDFVTAIALDKGKRVVHLESGISRLVGDGNMVADYGRLIVVATNILHYLERYEKRAHKRPVAGVESDGEENVTRREDRDKLSPEARRIATYIQRTVRAVLTWSMVLLNRTLGMSAVHESPFDKDGRRQYPAFDRSYLIDGRTVIMLDDVHAELRSYRNKRVLAVSGNFHAEGFTHYLSNPQSHADFERKVPMYRKKYGGVFPTQAKEYKDAD